MKVKLLKDILVQDHDVIPTKAGTMVDIPDEKVPEFEALGLVETKGDGKKAPPADNKMQAPLQNKAVTEASKK